MDENTGEITTYSPEDIKRLMAEAKSVPGTKRLIARTETSRPRPPFPDVDDFFKTFMPEQIPLKRLPVKGCKKCYGVGHRGKNLTTGKYVPCSCTQ